MDDGKTMRIREGVGMVPFNPPKDQKRAQSQPKNSSKGKKK